MAVANIDSKGVERRLRGAVVTFGVGLVVIAVARLTDAPLWAYGLVVIPFFLAASLTYQSLYRTCPALASHGTRDLGDGEEPIANPAERCMVSRQAKQVWLLTAATAVAATVLVVLAAKA